MQIGTYSFLMGKDVRNTLATNGLARMRLGHTR